MGPEERFTSVFQFPDPRQKRIYEELRELVGSGLAAFFRDACWIMANPKVLETSAHLIAHCLREIEEQFRMIFAPVIGKSKKLSKKEEIERIIGLLNLQELSENKRQELVEFWAGLYNKLSKFAHKRGVHATRDIEEVYSLWENTLLLFDVLLKAIRPRFLSWIAILDEILEKSKSNTLSDNDLMRLTHYIPASIVTHQYFFDKLENPEWLEPIWKKGFFKQPPEPIRDEEEGTIRFPPWPEAHYLARMAKYKHELVAQIIKDMEDAENISVIEDLVDAALALPPQVSATLVEKALKWAENPYLLFSLPDKLGALMAHWAKGGKAEEALQLAKVLLEVLPDRRKPLKEPYFLPPEPKARFDEWDYDQILKNHYLKLVETKPIPAIELLCNLLEKAVKVPLTKESIEDHEDYSYIWRPAIEDHPQNTDYDIRNILVEGIRDAAETVIRSGEIPLKEVIDFLESKQWKVFRRIALHLLRIFHEQAKDLIAERLTDRELFEDADVQHEYVLLLRGNFAALSEEDKRTILKWIEDGPDIDGFKKRVQEINNREPSGEEIKRYRETWQLTKLAWIGFENLPEDWKNRYEMLVQQYGEPEHPEFPAYMHVGWTGPTSPLDAEELKKMSVEEIVKFLRDWIPPENIYGGPSPEGLGRVLTSVVGEDPQRFAEKADLFCGLDPTYIRALISGFKEALEKYKKTFNWEKVLKLCQWVVGQPREIPNRKVNSFEADPDWVRTRREIANLFLKGLRSEKGEIPIKHRKEVWEILMPLTQDPEPSPEYERKSGMDPATLSINTVRGLALLAIIQYALWVRRYLEKQADGQERLNQGFIEMPEVRDVLEAHLDSAQDPSLTIRSVYGRCFPWLVLLDEQWASEHASQIFPLNEQDQDYFEVAWTSYIVFNKPYDNVLEILREQYSHAVEQIGHFEIRVGLLPSPDKRLAEHLMAFYWRGKVSLKDPMFITFWEKSPEDLRAHALEFIGRSLLQTEGDISNDIIQQLKSLWGFRLKKALESPGKYKKEMGKFGWWFVSQKFDIEWSFKQLLQSLQISDRAEPVDMILEQLASLVKSYPSESVECIKRIAEKDRKGWKIYSNREHIRKILQEALKLSNVSQKAREVINYLGSRGFIEFKDLLGREIP